MRIINIKKIQVVNPSSINFEIGVIFKTPSGEILIKEDNLKIHGYNLEKIGEFLFGKLEFEDPRFRLRYNSEDPSIIPIYEGYGRIIDEYLRNLILKKKLIK